MPDFIESVNVNLPLPKTFELFSDFERFPTFMDSIKEVRRTAEDRLHWRAEVGGRALDGVAQVEEQRHNERIVLSSVSGASVTGTITFEELDAYNSRVNLHIEYEPEGFLGSVGAALGAASGVVNEHIREDLKRFKEFAEASAGPIEGTGPIDATVAAPETEEQRRMAAAGNWPPKEEDREFLIGRRKGDPEPFTRLPPGEKGEPPDPS